MWRMWSAATSSCSTRAWFTALSASRISIDTRFCDYGAPVFVTNVEPHHGWRIESLCWESIYANWEHTDLQYYWRDYPGLFDQYGQGW